MKPFKGTTQLIQKRSPEEDVDLISRENRNLAPGLQFTRTSREFKVPKRRRRRKRHLKSDFWFFETAARFKFKERKRNSSLYVHVVDKT